MTRYASRREQGTIAPRSAPSPPSRPGRRTFARMVGAVAMITLTGLLFWLLTDDAFSVTEDNVTFVGLRHADEAQVRAYLSDLERAPNVFRVRASDIVSRLSELTEVDAARAIVTLPANVSVELDERDPLFIWSNRQVEWLVDETGMLFAPADSASEATSSQAATDAPSATPETSEAAAAAGEAGEVGEASEAEVEPAPDDSARTALPLVEDSRLAADPPVVGSHLGRTDMEVMRHLLAVTPQLLGSESQRLKLYVDEDDGYVLESTDGGWYAVFGHYTASIQPPSVIPRQVQCLRWALADREDRLDRIWLAVSDEACGSIRLTDQARDAQD